MTDEQLKQAVKRGATQRELRRGDVVRVKSVEEIKATLNSNDSLKGIAYVDTMYRYSDTKAHVRYVGTARVEINNNDYSWCPEWLELVEEGG